MEVSGQLHAPVALPPGKEPLVPLGYEVKEGVTFTYMCFMEVKVKDKVDPVLF
jgi:hypothetical protein